MNPLDFCLANFAVSKLAREYSKVVLTGDGGMSYLEAIAGTKNSIEFKIFRRKVPNFFKSITRNKGFRLCLQRQVPKLLSLRAREIDKLTYSDDMELYSLLLGSVPWRVKKKFRQKFEIDDDYDDEWYLRKFYKPEWSI